MVTTWFVLIGGKVCGPFDTAVLQQLADEGHIDATSIISCSRGGPWFAAKKVHGLFDEAPVAVGRKAAFRRSVAPPPFKPPPPPDFRTDKGPPSPSPSTLPGCEEATTAGHRESSERLAPFKNRIGIKFVPIPAGGFRMGSYGRSADEQPVHSVRISEPFLMAEAPVTQAQFEQAMDTKPWQRKKNIINAPTVAATYVSWDDAVDFCTWLTQVDNGRIPAGYRYRLPTEAEWEYACRAGTKTEWSFGDDEGQLGNHAWFNGNAGRKGENYAHGVRQKQPNLWGLYDMHGNVWEWCSDWYGETYYAHCPISDPKSPVAGSFRVARGGSWSSSPVGCRSAARGHDSPSYRGSFVGFRAVLSVE